MKDRIFSASWIVRGGISQGSWHPECKICNTEYHHTNTAARDPGQCPPVATSCLCHPGVIRDSHVRHKSEIWLKSKTLSLSVSSGTAEIMQEYCLSTAWCVAAVLALYSCVDNNPPVVSGTFYFRIYSTVFLFSGFPPTYHNVNSRSCWHWLSGAQCNHNIIS